MGFDVPVAVLAVGGRVGETEPFAVPAGHRDGGQDARIHAGLGLAPPAGGHRHGAERLDLAPQPGRHDLDHFGQRAHRGLRDALDRALRGRLQAQGQRDGFLVVDHQRGQGGARGQLVAALGTALSLDG